ncbi:protease SohB [Teredinibacter purpureus]|uniref:protease SohB n=1 Tax=Teredinibacter purpureus TaxID=2731756 RepID=UPI0005F83CEC|nr:protease SohB [Teredinibacter purpureus]
MEFLFEYGMFLAKSITLVVAIVAIVVVVAASSMKSQGQGKGHIEVTMLNEKFDDIVEGIKSVVLDESDLKLEEKKRKADAKLEKKVAKEKLKAAKKSKKEPVESDNTVVAEVAKKRVFVTEFDGDIKASATEELRKIVTAILALATENDEVVVKLESQGGMVHSYGLASSQLTRITDKNIPLTICVDKVAASGGYMMACVANKIISAPFAIIGSIGVVAQLPNFHRLLKKNDIDYEMLTAGEYKRTLTMFGEISDKGRKKFVEDLEDTHVLFKEFIHENRKAVDVDEVSTGEIWFGSRALAKNLVDEIQTSDQYLMDACSEADVFEINYIEKKTLPEKLGLSVAVAFDSVVNKTLTKLNNKIMS